MPHRWPRAEFPQRSVLTPCSDYPCLLALCLQVERPDEAGQLTCDGCAGLVELHSTVSQRGKPWRQPQLRLPFGNSAGLWQGFLTRQRLSADSRLEAIVPGRFGQQSMCVRVSAMLPRLVCSLLECNEGTRPRYPMSFRGCEMGARSPISATRPIAVISATLRSACSVHCWLETPAAIDVSNAFVNRSTLS